MRFSKEITPEIAEIAGLFAADGNLQKAHISLWGHIIEDREYYDIVLAKLFLKAFSFQARPHEKKSNSVYGFYVCRPDIIEYMHKDLGFCYGEKTYSVRVPKNIIHSKNQLIWRTFIRGVFDGDGTFVCFRRTGKYSEIRKKFHMEPQIRIGSVSEEFIHDISMLLARMDVKHAVWKTKAKKENESDCWYIGITGKKGVTDWMQKIGTNNPAKISKYNIFKIHGFVPPKTTLEQRKAILKGELDPLEWYSPAL